MTRPHLWPVEWRIMENKKSVFIKQGEIETTCSGEIIFTLLGSCVAVCLRDEDTGCSGMNHFMLASSQAGESSLRYGDYATRILVEKIKSLSGPSPLLVAKIFGGASVVDSISIDIGEKNVNAARMVLKEHRIRIGAESVGGTVHRKISFDTSTGRVRMYSPKKTEKRVMVPVDTSLEERKKLLLVDNVMERMLGLKLYLLKKGYRVIANFGDKSAVKKCEDKKVDVVITDADSALNEVNGVSFCLLCKQADALNDIPIIVYACAENNNKGFNEKRYADYYLDKISSVSNLHHQVGEILKTI